MVCFFHIVLKLKIPTLPSSRDLRQSNHLHFTFKGFGDRLNSAAEDLEAKSLLGGSPAPQFPHSPVSDLGVLTCKHESEYLFVPFALLSFLGWC